MISPITFPARAISALVGANGAGKGWSIPERGVTKFCRQCLGDGYNSYDQKGCPIEKLAYDIESQCENAL